MSNSVLNLADLKPPSSRVSVPTSYSEHDIPPACPSPPSATNMYLLGKIAKYSDHICTGMRKVLKMESLSDQTPSSNDGITRLGHLNELIEPSYRGLATRWIELEETDTCDSWVSGGDKQSEPKARSHFPQILDALKRDDTQLGRLKRSAHAVRYRAQALQYKAQEYLDDAESQFPDLPSLYTSLKSAYEAYALDFAAIKKSKGRSSAWRKPAAHRSYSEPIGMSTANTRFTRETPRPYPPSSKYGPPPVKGKVPMKGMREQRQTPLPVRRSKYDQSPSSRISAKQQRHCGSSRSGAASIPGTSYSHVPSANFNRTHSFTGHEYNPAFRPDESFDRHPAVHSDDEYVQRQRTTYTAHKTPAGFSSSSEGSHRRYKASDATRRPEHLSSRSYNSKEKKNSTSSSSYEQIPKPKTTFTDYLAYKEPRHRHTNSGPEIRYKTIVVEEETNGSKETRRRHSEVPTKSSKRPPGLSRTWGLADLAEALGRKRTSKNSTSVGVDGHANSGKKNGDRSRQSTHYHSIRQ